LNGEKSFVTLGQHVDQLVVFARNEDEKQGKYVHTKLVIVPKQGKGVKLVTLESTLPFIPEIPHAKVIFEDAPVMAILPGDGYADYLKPFRTIEDIHVQASLVGYLFRIAKEYNWPNNYLEKILSHIVAIRGLSFCEMTNPSVHITLAGILDRGNHLFDKVHKDWAHVNRDVREAWLRDIRILDIAKSAREKRREIAWVRIRDSKNL